MTKLTLKPSRRTEQRPYYLYRAVPHAANLIGTMYAINLTTALHGFRKFNPAHGSTVVDGDGCVVHAFISGGSNGTT